MCRNEQRVIFYSWHCWLRCLTTTFVVSTFIFSAWPILPNLCQLQHYLQAPEAHKDHYWPPNTLAGSEHCVTLHRGFEKSCWWIDAPLNLLQPPSVTYPGCCDGKSLWLWTWWCRLQQRLGTLFSVPQLQNLSGEHSLSTTQESEGVYHIRCYQLLWYTITL